MKAKFFALLAVVLAVVSCQRDADDLNVAMGGEQEVMLTVSLPEATRANSAEGGLSNIDKSKFTLRYILEIYRVEGDQIQDGTCQRFVKTTDETTVVFPVRLVAGDNRNYKIAAWADIVEKEGTVLANGEKADRYYDTQKGLDAVEIIEKGEIQWNAMDETRDAYTGFQTITDFRSASDIEEMELTRPFAKVRVVATDIDDIRKVGIIPTTATVEYSEQNMMPRIFNALTGEADTSTETEKSHSYTYTTTATKYDDNTGEYTLFADYIFVPSRGTAKFTLNVYDDKDGTRRLIKGNTFNTEIFVERNKLTTIKGDVLTTGGNVSVKVDNGLGVKETYNIVDTPESLQEVINNIEEDGSANIELGGDIDLSAIAGILSTRAGENAGLVIPANKTVVLDLNGYTISQEKECSASYSMIENKGNLTILDSSENKTGKISFKDNGQGDSAFHWGTYTLTNSGQLVVLSGTIENATAINTDGEVYHMYCAIQQSGGTTTIKGGNIINNTYRSVRTNRGNLVVEGGKFIGQIWMQPYEENTSISISNGEFQPSGADGSSVFVTNDKKNVVVSVTGGKFNTKFGCSDASKLAGVITDGFFTTTAKEGTNIQLLDDDSEWVAVEGETDLWTVGPKPVIAKIGEDGYTSIQKAVAAAQNGDTILFVADVEQVDGVIVTDKNITIDLNDKTFTVTNGANTNNRNFKVNGSSIVTIKNGTMVAEAEYSSGAYGTLRTEGTANVTLNDVKLYNYRGNGLNVKALSGTTVTITDAEVYSQYGGGIESAGGTIELTNVKVEQKGMYSAPYNSMAISVNGEGTVTVNSGTYSTECITAEEANNQGTSHGPWCAGVLNSGGTLIIKGGTFSNDNFGDDALATAARGLLLADTGANIEIKGGTFNALKSIIDIQNNKGDASKNPKATIFGGDFSANPLTWDGLISIADGYKVVENNGRWAVVVDPVAKIGSTEYATLEEAVAAAEAGNTITVLRDATLSAALTMPAGIILNGNGKQINGELVAGGDVTFVGHTKVTKFSAAYYNRTITIGEGACLEFTGTGRATLGYGNTFNITGSVENAKTADKANIQPSLIIPGGISITGGNDAAMNVTNAYVKIGSTTSKPGVANGKFTLNFDNAIVEFTKEFGFYEPTGGVAPEFVMNIKDSVFTTGTKLCIAAANSTVNVDNSVVALGDYLRNSGNLNLINGSVFTGRTIPFGENGGNNGAITVDNSSFTIVAGSTGHAFDGKGTGSITAQNGATVAVDYYKDMTISVDGTSTFTGTEVK